MTGTMAAPDREPLTDDELEAFGRRLEAYSDQLSPAERLLLGHIFVRAAVSTPVSGQRSEPEATDRPAPDLTELLSRVPRTECVFTVTVGDIALTLEQGIVFGTGQHPTTRLALDCIRRYLQPGMRMLDLGTGTGVLSIAAAKLGAASVLALDIDPDAAWLAARNVARNGVGSIVRVELGSLAEGWPLVRPPAGRFDVITANLGAAAFDHLASEFLDALAPRGVLIAGGVINELETWAREGLARAGGVVVDSLRAEEWRALVVARPGVRT